MRQRTSRSNDGRQAGLEAAIPHSSYTALAYPRSCPLDGQYQSRNGRNCKFAASVRTSCRMTASFRLLHASRLRARFAVCPGRACPRLTLIDRWTPWHRTCDGHDWWFPISARVCLRGYIIFLECRLGIKYLAYERYYIRWRAHSPYPLTVESLGLTILLSTKLCRRLGLLLVHQHPG
jgi:hypothetical protein